MCREVTVDELAGCFVVEVGQRQAWTFIGFADNRPTPGRETRLYFDADWRLKPPMQATEDNPILQLLELDGFTIETALMVGEPLSLVITFDGGPQLTIAGEPAYPTSGEAWWLTDWR